MNVGVVYLLTNSQLAARLVVSIHSLRKWYDGPVTVFTTRPESHEIGELLLKDKRLAVDHRTTTEAKAKDAYTAAYLTKAVFLGQSPYEGTVFLDAHTLIVGPIDELLSSVRTSPITATIYGPAETDNWKTNHNLMAWKSVLEGRPKWRKLVALLNLALGSPLPLVNTGVLAIQRELSVLHAWQELTWIGRATPTPDESALQLLLLSHHHQLLGFEFNCLPYFAGEVCDVRIWHFAGATHLRIPQGRKLWLPAYRECAKLNVAELRKWSRVELRKFPKSHKLKSPRQQPTSPARTRKRVSTA